MSLLRESTRWLTQKNLQPNYGTFPIYAWGSVTIFFRPSISLCISKITPQILCFQKDDIQGFKWHQSLGCSSTGTVWFQYRTDTDRMYQNQQFTQNLKTIDGTGSLVSPICTGKDQYVLIRLFGCLGTCTGADSCQNSIVPIVPSCFNCF